MDQEDNISERNTHQMYTHVMPNVVLITSNAECEAASLAIEHLKSKSKFKHHLVVDNDNDTHIRRIMLLYRISNIRIVSYSRSGQLRNIGATYPPLQTRQSYTGSGLRIAAVFEML